MSLRRVQVFLARDELEIEDVGRRHRRAGVGSATTRRYANRDTGEGSC
jgi:hypothetical protein